MSAIKLGDDRQEVTVETDVVLPSGIEIQVSGEILINADSIDFNNMYFANGKVGEIAIAKEIISEEAREIFDDPDNWELSQEGPLFSVDSIDHTIERAA